LFENVSDEDLESLQISAFETGAKDAGRTDAAPQRHKVGSADRFDARTTAEKPANMRPGRSGWSLPPAGTEQGESDEYG